jgi:hypothetical protein
VSITRSGLIRNRATGLYYSTVTITNTGATDLTGELDIVLANLTAGATLTNATGATGDASPWVRVQVGVLSVGAKVTVRLAFSLSSSAGTVNYTTKAFLLV